MNRPLLYYVVRKVYSILDAKHKRGLLSVIELLAKYSRFAICSDMEASLGNALFKALRVLITRMEVVVELGISSYFFNMI